jgi:hypothetical protein
LPENAIIPYRPSTPMTDPSTQRIDYTSQPWLAPMGCVSWTATDSSGLPTTQWEARFRDIRFFVQTDVYRGGRRIHTHEYPGKESWENEDLGRARQQIQVAAYVVGDQVQLWASKLFAACTDPAVGKLWLPHRVPIDARCLTVESTFNADTMGRIDFSMLFALEVEMDITGHKVTPAYSTQTPSQVENLVDSTALNSARAARLQFEEQFTGAQPHTGRRAAADMMRDVARGLRVAGKQARLKAGPAARLESSVRRILREAEYFADGQRTAPNKLTPTAAVTNQRMVHYSNILAVEAGLRSPGETTRRHDGWAMRTSTGQVLPVKVGPNEGFGGRFDEAMDILQASAPYPGDLPQALYSLTRITPHRMAKAMQPSSRAASVRAEFQLAETVAAYARRRALAASARATIKVAPEKQPEALRVRQRLVHQLDIEIELVLGRYPRTYATLRKLRAAVIEYMVWWTRGGPATQNIRPTTVGPLAVIAANLYYRPGDRYVNRDRELMQLNGIAHPLFGSDELAALRH